MNTTPTVNVIARVATPQLSAQLGWAQVAGMWGQSLPVGISWQARRTARARWGPVAEAQRQIWRRRGL